MKPFAPSSPERFVQLDALRFAFAVIVVLVHTIGFRLTLIHGGFAVDFFFILSGFVLSHALIHRPAPSAQFAWARLARLYPLHLAMLLWLLFLVAGALADPPTNYQLTALGLNLVLLQGVWAADVHTWNFPSWSISVEFVVNVVLLYPVVRARNIAVAAAIVLLSGATIVATWGPVFDEFTIQPIHGTFLAGGLLRGAGGILLGYLLYEAYLVLQPRFARPPRSVIHLATGFEIVVIGALVFSLWVDDLGWNLLPVPLSAVLILQMAAVPGRVAKLLQGRTFAFLGGISYSIYLIHIPLFATFVGADLLPLPDTAYSVVWPAYFAFLLTLSTASYRYIEQPAQRALMRLFKGWRTTPSHETPA
jgi:peptidoglycan/LPS O-acetylase OafA/YrhL